MTEQHYNLEYLNKTTQALEAFKAHSYEPFNQITSGKIADIGCGSGDDVVRMAKIFESADVEVVGVDNQPEMIEAGILSAQQLPNVSFLLGEATTLPFGDDELSGLRNERLIQHLTDPEKAFAEFYRVLRPEGPIVISETDWSSLSFYNGDLRTIGLVREYFNHRNVNNGLAAVSLLHHVEKAGFRDMAIQVFPMTSYSFSQCILMTRLDQVLVSMKSDGIISDRDEKDFFAELQQADRAGHFVCALNLVMVKAKK